MSAIRRVLAEKKRAQQDCWALAQAQDEVNEELYGPHWHSETEPSDFEKARAYEQLMEKMNEIRFGDRH